VRRVYDTPAADDGMRILVDRLWPRGVAKRDLALDRWAKELAPSTALRTWYGHRPERFEEFRRRYREELSSEPAATEVGELRQAAADRTITVLTATRDVERSGAAVLAQVLAGHG